MTEQITKIPLYPKKDVPRTADQEFDALHRSGFSEALIQTDDFDGTVIIVRNEESLGIQTEPYVDKPAVHRKPPAVRAMGVRTEQQKRTLFDFDSEVVPIVTTLVQKALTQASMEVGEELELEQMRRYLRAFEQKAQRETEGIARLEEIEAKKFSEKEKVLQEKRARAAAYQELRTRVFVRGFAEFFAWDIGEEAIHALDSRGYFYDEVERDVERDFLPWLTAETEAELARPAVAPALAEAVLQHAITFVDTQCGEMEISAQIDVDQTTIKEARIMRAMLIEDIVSTAVRKSKKINRRQKQADQGAEEDANEPEGRASGSGYDSET
jgi:hypothetical protein